MPGVPERPAWTNSPSLAEDYGKGLIESVRLYRETFDSLVEDPREGDRPVVIPGVSEDQPIRVARGMPVDDGEQTTHAETTRQNLLGGIQTLAEYLDFIDRRGWSVHIDLDVLRDALEDYCQVAFVDGDPADFAHVFGLTRDVQSVRMRATMLGLSWGEMRLQFDPDSLAIPRLVLEFAIDDDASVRNIRDHERELYAVSGERGLISIDLRRVAEAMR